MNIQRIPKSNTKANMDVVIAILAKDKEHCLPLYLKCIYNQTYPKNHIYLYIRTNNNNDKTVEVLENWITEHQEEYAGIYFDKTDVEENVQQYTQHEWNGTRFAVLGRIRQESVDYAKQIKAHYFVVDCDNFILPLTLEKILDTHLPIVAPLLRTSRSMYSNYHHATDENGYFKDTPEYHTIWNCKMKGLIEVDVVHCTYLIRQEFLSMISYQDGSGRYEYVIFSSNLRKKGISQYIDNREKYGWITFAENQEEMEEEMKLFSDV